MRSRRHAAVYDTESTLPIRLIQNDEFVLSFRKRHLLLRKQLDFLTNDVNTSRRARKRASYRSSDAFSSITAFLYASPSIAFAKHMILVVFPVPGGPYNGNGRSKPTARRMWGRFPLRSPAGVRWSPHCRQSLTTTPMSVLRCLLPPGVCTFQSTVAP